MPDPQFEWLVVGAGFGGLRALAEARRQGVSARLLEAAPDLGGTWYWNRYPGARSDVESWVYGFELDGLLRDRDWPDRYPARAQVLAYLSSVAERHDLLGHIDFDTRVERAIRDDTANTWTVHTNRGSALTCRYLVLALGVLSQPLQPIPGAADFRGEHYLTARWPEHPVSFDGKRVAVIGTGSSGVQIIPRVARTAAHLTVFQRTPNYVLPTRNDPVDEDLRHAIRREFDAIWRSVRTEGSGHGVTPTTRTVNDVDETEAQRVLERAWEAGGIRFMHESFADIMTDARSNALVSTFQHRKIRAIVTDPLVAELLVPTHPLGAKRPPMGNGYYETFNRPNVSLIDVGANALETFLPDGLRQVDGTEHGFDMVVSATGFDVGTGAFLAVDVRGRDGRSLAEAWRDGAQTYLGVAVTGFPNLFMLGGPGSAAGNMPPTIERAVVWVGEALAHMRSLGADVIEADQAAMEWWGEQLQGMISHSLLADGAAAHSYFVGANVAGKPIRPLLYLAGTANYVNELTSCAKNDYRGFTVTASPRRSLTPDG